MREDEEGRFFEKMQERDNALPPVLRFFTLEINRLDDAALAEQLKSRELAHYAPWLRDTRAFRPHQLSDELEKLLHEKYVAGRAAWTRLFDETGASLRFSIDGNELTSAEALHLLSDRDPDKRKRPAKALGDGFGRNVRLFVPITNTLAKAKEIGDRRRGFKRPISSRNLS